MINFIFCTVLLPGASKVDETHKFDDFLNLIVISNDWGIYWLSVAAIMNSIQAGEIANFLQLLNYMTFVSQKSHRVSELKIWNILLALNGFEK